jgi:hypothetical protein
MTSASGWTARIALRAVSNSCPPPSQLAQYSTVNLFDMANKTELVVWKRPFKTGRALVARTTNR